MDVNRGKQDSDVEQTPKNILSSDCRLQPACMKMELLVIADQHAAVNTFPGLATDNLTVDQIKGIYTGELTTWADVQ